MKPSLFLSLFIVTVTLAYGQILDLDIDYPIIFPKEYVVQNEIHEVTYSESGDNIAKHSKKNADAVITYFFDTAGTPFMKVLTDNRGYVDSFMMNGMRCEYKSDPDSRFYEENVFCNDKGMIIANQTDKSNFFYRYDSLDRIREWIEIDREEDAEANVFLTMYKYKPTGQLDSIINKEGVLRYNLGSRQMDTIYKSSYIKTIRYADSRISAVTTYTNNNRDQVVAASTYRYKYKGDKLSQVDLYIGEDKKSIYTLKLIRTE
jgi:hypothetical protein